MSDPFNIYVDRLRDGPTLKIKENFSPDFLDVHETDLSFSDPVAVSGEAYLAEDHLIIHLKIKTTASIPCTICNNPVKFAISIGDFYHAEPLAEIRSPIFNYKEPLREAILIQVPPFTECHEGKCPERESVNKFLKKDQKPDAPPTMTTYFPFADIDKKKDKT